MVDKALLANWVAALRSGNYEQTNDQLYNDCIDAYCCLGVLCKVAGAEFTDISIKDEWTEFYTLHRRPVLNDVNLADGDEELLSDDMLARLGFDSEIQSRLIGMNDGTNFEGKKYSFTEIADYIEEKFLNTNG